MKPELTDILVIDDQEAILTDFARLLEPAATAHHADELDDLASVLGGSGRIPKSVERPYHVRYARQGLDGVREHASRLALSRPVAVAFVDIHMPPGIDGVETVRQLWQAQPDIEVVLCTAFSDYSWQAILQRLDSRDQLVILRKPFDPIEVRQLAACLSEKWLRGRALSRRMSDLEAQVAREVDRRMQVELQHAQKFEALGRLAAGVAHEINTPTQYIQSSLEFLSSAVTEALEGNAETLADAPGAIADAMDGVQRVTALVRSVREYAHTSHRRELEQVDLNRQIRMVAELARSQYKHDADLVLDLAERLPTILGNADELGRALLNLLVNAAQAVQTHRKAMQKGRITITSRSTADTVTITVSDTGGGIPMEHWGRVFEPFFTTKPRGQGTGQGLAIAHAAIVERHRGSLRFDSKVGEGTTFHISLPIQVMEKGAA
jgi:two-component system, NtrC family, sensor kinase